MLTLMLGPRGTAEIEDEVFMKIQSETNEY